jgi:hypothetical protein
MPVAKRNFRVRHHHFGEAEAATPLFAPAATASASVASPGPPARSSFTYPSTNTTTNDRDGAGSDKRNLGLVGMVTPSLYSSNRSSGCTTIDSILQEIGLQALLQQSVSMSSGSQSQLDIDTLTRIGAINNTSLLSPRQLLSPHSVASLHQHSLPPAVSAHAAMRLGSNNKKNDVPMDNKMPKPLMTFPCQARGMPADHKRASSILAFGPTLRYITCYLESSQIILFFLAITPLLFLSCIPLLQTAHFVIPRNIKHGDSLTCSYAACRDVGVKFYFCVHCNIPVAKRCFRRHHHSEDGAAAVATITNLAHQSSLDNDTSSRTICSSYSSPNPSQAFFELPSSSSGGGGRVDSISALTAPTASPVSQPSKKRPPSSSFDHGSDRHVAKMPKRSDSNFDSCAASSAASSASSSALSSSCKIAMTGDSTITDGPLY